MRLLLLPLLLSGCAIRGEIGAGGPGLAHEAIGGKAESPRRFALLAGGEVMRDGDLSLDLFAGPAAVAVDGSVRCAGIDATPRVRYTGLGLLEPYMTLELGAAWADFEAQGTGWGFTLGIGPGARMRISDRTWVSLDYRAWHESNGSAIFGSPGPNPGYNGDVLLLGMEWRF